MALDKGETALAEVAKRKAEQIESESLGMLVMRIFFFLSFFIKYHFSYKFYKVIERIFSKDYEIIGRI
jgi:ABC-type multidrug transport system permease subunit